MRESSNNDSSVIDISIWSTIIGLSITLILLKIFGIISFGWWLVTTPIWIMTVVFICLTMYILMNISEVDENDDDTVKD